MAEAQQRAQVLTDEYQKLQAELQTIVSARQKLESQQQENKGVKREFDSLAEEANIYKLVGPVLLKQEKTEAVMAVDGRLEFIDNEIKRTEKQIADIQASSDAKRSEIINLQSQASPQQTA
ncbi:hypothetical protein VE00_02353 [Pseudogymnoascus sp. WSF 3629]|nr:hypothetical protein VE00_02353 [Pseudogymnoascus sp. WSF 3629]